MDGGEIGAVMGLDGGDEGTTVGFYGEKGEG